MQRDTRPEIVIDVALQAYLERVCRRTTHLPFGSHGPIAHSEGLRLGEIWQEPQAELLAASTGGGPARANVRAEVPAPLRAFLECFPSLAVTAPPGYGKSTLCSWIANENAASLLRAPHRGRVPVLISLRHSSTAGDWTEVKRVLSRGLDVGEGDDCAGLLYRHWTEGNIWLLLDGLDEAEYGLQIAIRKGMGLWSQTDNRILITCRDTEYLRVRPFNIPTIVLLGLTDEQRAAYIPRWHSLMYPGSSAAERDSYLARVDKMLEGQELQSLAKTPLFAALICVVASSITNEVTGRASLLNAAMEQMLAPRDMCMLPLGIIGQTGDEISVALLGRILEELAWRMTLTEDPLRDRYVVNEKFLVDFVRAFLDRSGLASAPAATAQAALDACLCRLYGTAAIGMLRRRLDGLEFVHRIFQDHFSAEYMRRHLSPSAVVDYADRPALHGVMHAYATLPQVSGQCTCQLMVAASLLKGVRLQADDWISVEAPPTNESVARAILGAEMLICLGREALQKFGGADALASDSRPPTDALSAEKNFAGLWLFAARAMLGIARSDSLSFEARSKALCAASLLCDLRFFSPDGTPSLAMGAWTIIPGGRGTVGSARELERKEKKTVRSCPSAPVEMSQFRIARFAVTNYEFAQFISDNGYGDEQYWESDAARLWRQQDEGFLAACEKLFLERADDNYQKESSLVEIQSLGRRAAARFMMRRNRPMYWCDARFNLPTGPVVGVNFWEASAYCAWLTNRLREQNRVGAGERVSLPTENEFEWAASKQWRPPNKKLAYAWGDVFDANRCLVRDFASGAQVPPCRRFGALPVGYFDLNDRGDSHISDLSGNVWQWVIGHPRPHGTPPDPATMGPLTPTVVRGGSWFSLEPLAAHSSFRQQDEPCNAYWDLGFRFVLRSEH